MAAHSPVGAKIYVDYGRSSDLSRSVAPSQNFVPMACGNDFLGDSQQRVLFRILTEFPFNPRGAFRSETISTAKLQIIFHSPTKFPRFFYKIIADSSVLNLISDFVMLDKMLRM